MIEEILPILSRNNDTIRFQSNHFESIKYFTKKYCLAEYDLWTRPLLKQLHQTIFTIKQILEEKENGMNYDADYLNILFIRVEQRARNIDYGIHFPQDQPIIMRQLEYESTLEERRKHRQISELLLTLNERFAIQCSTYVQKCIDLHSYIRVLGVGKDNVEQLATQMGILPLTSVEKEHLLQKCDPLVIPLQSFASCTTERFYYKQFSIAEDQRRSLTENMKQQTLVNDSRDLYRLVAETPFLPSSEFESNSSLSNKSISVDHISSILDKNRWIVILGDPGSAKTTLVRWLILQVAKKFIQNQMNNNLPARLPILVRVGELASALDRDPNLSLIDYLCQPTWFGTSLIQISNDEQFIREYIKHGHTLIILDGLDEIPSFRQRQHIVRLIEQFLQKWTVCPVTFIAPFDELVLNDMIKPLSCSTVGNQVIITSRIVGYHMCPIASVRIEHYILAPLTLPIMNSFIDHWFISVHSSLEIFESKSNKAMISMTTLADGLKSMLSNNEGLQKLTSNSMMLAVLCTLTLLQSNEEIRLLQKQRICLLHTTSEFTLESCLKLFNKREVFLHSLIDIALHLHEHSPSGLIEELDMKNVLRRSANTNEDIIDGFIHLVDSETYLFVPRGLCIYGFSHLMFEEYYVCLHILGLTEENNVELNHSKYVADRFHRYVLCGSRFREPLILALSYISWQWSEVEYHSFCTYLLNENDFNRFSKLTPLGAICLLSSIRDLVRLPSKEMLSTMLNQCIQASATNEWFHNFPIFVGILKTAMNELPSTFVQEWFLQANENVIETMAQLILQMNTLPTWFNQSMCHHMWNRLILTNHRLSCCLFPFISQFDKTLLPKNDLYQYMITNEICVENIHPLILSIIICLCGGLNKSEIDENIIEFSPELMQRNSHYSSILSKYLYSDPQELLNYCHDELSSNSSDISIDLLIMCCCLEGCNDKFLTFPLIQRLQQLATYICSIYLGKERPYNRYKPNTKQILTLLAPLIDGISHDDSSPPYSLASIIIVALSRLLSARDEDFANIKLPYELCHLNEEQLNSELFILSRTFQSDFIPATYRRLFTSQSLSTMYRTFLSAAYIIELSIDAYERWCNLLTEDNIQETLTFDVAQWIDAQIQRVDEDKCHRLSQALFKCQTFIDVNVTNILIQWLSYRNNRNLREFAYHSAFLLFNINSTATILCCQLLGSELDDFRRRSEELFNKNIVSSWRLGQDEFISFVEICQTHANLTAPHIFESVARIRIYVEHIHSLNALYLVLDNKNIANIFESFSLIFDPSIQSHFISRLEKYHAATEHSITTILVIFSRTVGKWNKLEVNRGITAVVHLLRKYANSMKITSAALAVFTRWRSYNYVKHIILQNRYPEAIRINAIRWLYKEGKHKGRWKFLNQSTSKFSSSIVDAALERTMYWQCTHLTHDNQEPTAEFLLNYYSNDHLRVFRTLITLHSDNAGLGLSESHISSQIFTELCTEHKFDNIDTVFVHTICIGLMNAQNNPSSTLSDTQLNFAVEYTKKREVEFFRAVRNSVLGEQGFKKALYIISKKSNVRRRLAALKLLVYYGELTMEIAEIFLDLTLETFIYQQDACSFIWRLRRIPNRQISEYLLDKLKNESLQQRYMAALLLVQLAVNDQVSTNTVFKHIRNVINDSTSAMNVYLTSEFLSTARHSVANVDPRKGRLDQALATLLMQFSFIAGKPYTDEFHLYAHYTNLFLNYDLLFEKIRVAPRFVTCRYPRLHLPISVDSPIDENNFDYGAERWSFQEEHDPSYLND